MGMFLMGLIVGANVGVIVAGLGLYWSLQRERFRFELKNPLDELFDPCPRCGGDHDRIDRREPCPEVAS